jgi:hypothetical protein
MKMQNKSGTEVFAHNATLIEETANVDSKHIAPSQSLSARNRRRFLKGGMFAAGATVLGAGVSPSRLLASDGSDDRAPITKGDIAILRFLQALETIEADLWQQYSELGGTQDNEVSGVNGGNVPYTQALQLLDGDMPQYVHDNTDDEISHSRFLSNYLQSIGVQPVDLTQFAFAQQQSRWGEAGGAADQSYPTHHRYQLLVAVSQHHQSRFRPECSLRSSRSELECGNAHCDSEEQ